YLAHCAPERIPMTLVEGAIEHETEALGALSEVSLVKHDPFEDGTQAVTVHRLVQAAGRARSQENGSVQEAVERLVASLAAIYPEECWRGLQSWRLCAHLTPHLLARRDACPASLLDRAGDYLFNRAAYSQAGQLFRDALAIREKMLGPEHPDTATSLNRLSQLLDCQGDPEALPLCERALAIREKVLGLEHPDTGSSLSSLAHLRWAQGDFAGAVPLYERALAIREKMLGPEHPDTAASLAYLRMTQGDLAGAVPLYERALAICEKTLS